MKNTQNMLILFVVATMTLFSTTFYSSPAYGQCSTDVPKNLLSAGQSGGTSFGLTSWSGIVWPTSVIRVEFLGGSATQREYVRKHALEWARKTNIQLLFHVRRASHIRISFEAGTGPDGQPIGSFSKLGTKANLYKEKPTMNFAWLDQRNVLHEFGHAFGFPHEHLRPDLNIIWNKPAVLAYTAKNYGWNEERTNFNILNPLNLRGMITSKPDPVSIMTYPVLKDWTLNNFEIPSINTLSQIDIAFTNRVYKNLNVDFTCNNFEPRILFNEFNRSNLRTIQSWQHHCNAKYNFKSFATDVQGRNIWMMYDRNQLLGEQVITEWVEKSRRSDSLKGARITLEPYGKKAKELYQAYVPGVGQEHHSIRLLQGSAEIKKSYRREDGTLFNKQEYFQIGQGKFYK